MNGIIFDIQRCCTKDGPGIRTTVFFKGCPLRCLWCHNPESQHSGTEKMQKAKEEGWESCGKEYTVDAVMDVVLKDRIYYQNSGGGLTLSGGEPFFQSEFTLKLLQAAKKEGLHTAVETCGMMAEDILRQSTDFVDLYLYDFKESDPTRHQEYTGTDGVLILQNLAILGEMKKQVILRCPIIPHLNDRADHFAAIAGLTRQYPNIQKVQIEPYHSFGADKYRRLGRDYALEQTQPPTDAQVEQWIREISEQTKTPIERA